MKKRHRILAFLLAGLMMVTIPADVMASDAGDTGGGQYSEETDTEVKDQEPAQDTGETTDEQENELSEEKPLEEEPSQENLSQDTESTGQVSDVQAVPEEVKEMPGQENPVSVESVEENMEPAESVEEDDFEYYDPEDPGNYRLEGKADAAFGSSVSAMAASPAKFNDCIIQHGIDVSYHNGTINWGKVKKDNNGNFAIVRVAYRGYSNGALTTDVKAKENLLNANAAGVPVGAYIFSQAISAGEAVAEADYIINKIQSFGSGAKVTLPIVLDYEYVATGVGRLYKAKLSKAAATEICKAFCDRVRERGYTPMVYANKSMLTDKMYAADFSQDSAIWMAHYTNQSNYAGEYEYWQYSDSGKTSGVSTKTDLNFRYINTLRISGRSVNSISMKWEPYGGSSSYTIKRKNGSSYETVKTTTDLTFTDTGLSPGCSYSYKIYCNDGNFSGKCIGFNTGITALGCTSTVSAKGIGFDCVKVSWSATSGASGYYVQRAAANSSSYGTVSVASGTSYKDGNRNAGTAYKYRVVPYKVVFNGRSNGNISNEASAKTLSTIKGKTKNSKLKLRKKASTSSKSLGTIKKKGTAVTIIGSSGSWYKLKVKIGGKLKTGYMKKNRIKVNDPTSVEKTKISIKSRKANKIKIGWKKVPGASGYQVQRYNKKKKAYETIKTITKGSTVSWTNSGLRKNTSYKYRVRAYKNYSGDRFYGSYSSAKSAKTKKK